MTENEAIDKLAAAYCEQRGWRWNALSAYTQDQVLLLAQLKLNSLKAQYAAGTTVEVKITHIPNGFGTTKTAKICALADISVGWSSIRKTMKNHNLILREDIETIAYEPVQDTGSIRL